ncbi:hypothetical protein T484DRAFT_1919278, partial [Baffinella frigidus]
MSVSSQAREARQALHLRIPGEEGTAWQRFGDDSCERSGAEGELLAGIHWGALGRMRGGGSDGGWHGPPGDDYDEEFPPLPGQESQNP